MRRWSRQKDGCGYYYTTDGHMPQLNVRLEHMAEGEGRDFRWVSYCGDTRVGAFWSKETAQQEAETYWLRNHKEGP